MNGYETVLAAAEHQDLIASKNGSKFSARCPAHEDSRASLSVAAGDDGRALVFCFAGCTTPAVVEALGLQMRELFGDRDTFDAAEYVYTDEVGEPLIRVTRTWPKGFRQERWDPDDGMWKNRLLGTRRVLYNLPAVASAPVVWIVEGEKDVEALRREDIIATTLLGGAGNWKDEYADSLRGKTVHILADRDKPGQEGALRVRNGARSSAKSISVWIPPEGYKDVSDMLNAGLGLRDCLPLEQDQGQFEPMDWEEWDPEQVSWLMEPYIPAGSRVLAFGPSGSLKSLWAMWICSQLAKEGHRVAYFSLEMSPREVAKRLHKMAPPKERFRLFRRLSFESSSDLAAICDLLKGYSLIVVDSWSAVHGDTNNNDAVARLDREFFLPIVEETGATLLILDNTGQAIITDRGARVQSDWARGASAKGDKMDMTIMLERPDPEDNHKTRFTVKKIRGENSLPKPVTARTDKDNIDFRIVDSHGTDLGSMWPDGEGPPVPEDAPVPDAPPSLLDRLREAREAQKLKELKGLEEENA